MARHLMILKNLKRIYREAFHPHAILPLKLNGNVTGEPTNKSILSFVTTYLVVFFFGTILLILTGLDGKTSAGAAATAMAGIGPGIGTAGPAANFAHLSDFAKLIMSLLMVLGRLEIFTVTILFTRSFWKE